GEKYQQNREYLISLIKKEAMEGKISDKVINEAIDLHLKNEYEIKDSDAKGLTGLAELYYELKEDFKVEKNPYQILSSMSPETFKNNLQTVFTTYKTYRVESVPPLLFEYDIFLFFIGSIMLSVFLYRSAWHNKDEIKSSLWSVKTASTPGMVGEVLFLFCTSLVLSYLIQ